MVLFEHGRGTASAGLRAAEAFEAGCPYRASLQGRLRDRDVDLHDVGVLEDQLHLARRQSLFVWVIQFLIKVIALFVLEIHLEIFRETDTGRNVGASLIHHLVDAPGSFITPEVKCRVATLLFRLLVGCVVVVRSHSMIPFQAVNFVEPARFFDCRRESPARNANGYFGLFLLGTSLGEGPSALTTAA